MELEIFERLTTKKNEIKKLRWENNIPAVLYLKGSSQNIFIKKEDFETITRKIPKGRLSTTIFTLKNKDKSFKAIIKEIQYNPVNYQIIHLDFLKLLEKKEISINIPIEIIGEDKCIGIKEGGSFKRILRHLKIKCLPQDIPKNFILDVTDLKIGQSKKIKDIDISENIKHKRHLEEVVVSIIKR
ncbi:MAG: hypothetical protein AMS24_05050 [Chlamydiae bacterium SM23_39]|nr:MAG: hypothetical protein AMS24_05050 [Chlamydiae bacterium SM23_39]